MVLFRVLWATQSRTMGGLGVSFTVVPPLHFLRLPTTTMTIYPSPTRSFFPLPFPTINPMTGQEGHHEGRKTFPQSSSLPAFSTTLPPPFYFYHD